MGFWNKIVDRAQKIEDTIKDGMNSAIAVGKKIIDKTNKYLKSTIKVTKTAINKSVDTIKKFINTIDDYVLKFRIPLLGTAKIKGSNKKNKKTTIPQDNLRSLSKEILDVLNALDEFNKSQLLSFDRFARFNLVRIILKDLIKKINSYGELNTIDISFLILSTSFLNGTIVDSDLYLFDEEVHRRFHKSLAEFGLEQINKSWTEKFIKLEKIYYQKIEENRMIEIEINQVQIKKSISEISQEEETQLSNLLIKRKNYNIDITDIETQKVEMKMIICVIEGLLQIAANSTELPNFVRNKYDEVIEILMKLEQDVFVSQKEKILLQAFAAQFWESLNNKYTIEMEIAS